MQLIALQQVVFDFQARIITNVDHLWRRTMHIFRKQEHTEIEAVVPNRIGFALRRPRIEAVNLRWMRRCSNGHERSVARSFGQDSQDLYKGDTSSESRLLDMKGEWLRL